MAIERYKVNPFLEGMTIPVKGKQVKLSRLGRDDNVLVNQSTGEIKGTHVVTYKKVDSEQFIKLFSANIGMTFGLSSAGIKTLGVLIWTMQRDCISKDEVDLDAIILQDFIDHHKNAEVPLSLSMATFKRGIVELETAQIVAKTVRAGRYFINPNFAFNGDRIAFTTLIERK